MPTLIMSDTKQLRVLSISTDRDIFREGSEVLERIKDIGTIVDELHIIVFSKSGFQTTQVALNVWVYPTNSFSRWLYIFDAYVLAKKMFLKKQEGFAVTSSLVDLVTTQDPFECGLAGYFISNKLHIPLHLQIHTDFLNEYFRTHTLLNRIRVAIAKYLLRGKVNVRVVSERIKTSILEMFPREKIAPAITLLPVFVDTQKFKNAPETRFLSEKYPGYNLLVLVVSRLEKEKNVSLALRLIAEIRSSSIELRPGLVIAGRGSEEKHLRSLAKKLHIKDHVFFEGHVSDLPSYYKSADVLLVTSHYEGYGRMFLEAMVSGCPVLTDDVGAAKEIIGRWNGFVCEEDDEECLLRNLVSYAKDPAMLDQLKKSARASAEHFIPKTKEQYLSEFQKMLKEASERVD